MGFSVLTAKYAYVTVLKQILQSNFIDSWVHRYKCTELCKRLTEDEVRQCQGWEEVRDQHLKAWGAEAFPESSEIGMRLHLALFRSDRSVYLWIKTQGTWNSALPCGKAVRCETLYNITAPLRSWYYSVAAWGVGSTMKAHRESRNRRGVGDGLPQKPPLYTCIHRGVRRSFSFCAKCVKSSNGFSYRQGDEFVVMLTESLRSNSCSADMVQPGCSTCTVL